MAKAALSFAERVKLSAKKELELMRKDLEAVDATAEEVSKESTESKESDEE